MTSRGSASTSVSLEDLKLKAERLRDLAEAGVRRGLEEQAVRNVVIVAGVVLLAVGAAYFAGSRRGCDARPRR